MEIEVSPEDMFRRVAANIARADLCMTQRPAWPALEEQFYEMLASLQFMPNSPILMNAGRRLQQLFGCFVLPLEDSIEDIFEMVKQAALIHKKRRRPDFHSPGSGLKMIGSARPAALPAVRFLL